MSNRTLQISLQSRERLIPRKRATRSRRSESSRRQHNRDDSERVTYSRRQLDPPTSDFLERFHFSNLLFLNLNSDPKTDRRYSISSGASRNPSAAL
jgi:hypothetical protein